MSPFQLKIVYGSKHVTWQLALQKTPCPQKHPVHPVSQTYHFPRNTTRLQCQTFTAHWGHPPTPLPMGPGASFQVCLKYPVLTPATSREQQAWGCTRRRRRVPTEWAGQCPPQAGCRPTAPLLFLQGDNTYHCLPYPSPCLHLLGQP